jgi:hypothetical protein
MNQVIPFLFLAITFPLCMIVGLGVCGYLINLDHLRKIKRNDFSRTSPFKTALILVVFIAQIIVTVGGVIYLSNRLSNQFTPQAQHDPNVYEPKPIVETTMGDTRPSRIPGMSSQGK